MSKIPFLKSMVVKLSDFHSNVVLFSFDCTWKCLVLCYWRWNTIDMVFLSANAPNYTYQHSTNWLKVFNPCRSFFLLSLGSPEARLQVHRILLKFAEKRSAVAPSRRSLDFVMAIYYVIHSQSWFWICWYLNPFGFPFSLQCFIHA